MGYTTIDLYDLDMAVLGVFVLVTLACARITRLFTGDKISEKWRHRVIKKYGEGSLRAYWAFCEWCLGMPVAVVGGVVWALTTLPWQSWWLAVPAALAISHLIGLLHRLEG